MSIEVKDLARYVDAVATLVHSIEEDLRVNDNMISSETVNALSELHAANNNIAVVTEALEKHNIKLN